MRGARRSARAVFGASRRRDKRSGRCAPPRGNLQAVRLCDVAFDDAGRPRAGAVRLGPQAASPTGRAGQSHADWSGTAHKRAESRKTGQGRQTRLPRSGRRRRTWIKTAGLLVFFLCSEAFSPALLPVTCNFTGQDQPPLRLKHSRGSWSSGTTLLKLSATLTGQTGRNPRSASDCLAPDHSGFHRYFPEVQIQDRASACYPKPLVFCGSPLAKALISAPASRNITG